jgi:hypothetical protein
MVESIVGLPQGFLAKPPSRRGVGNLLSVGVKERIYIEYTSEYIIEVFASPTTKAVDLETTYAYFTSNSFEFSIILD